MDPVDIRKSLISAGIWISAAIIAGSLISTHGLKKTLTSLNDSKMITVTGTAGREVKSDLAVWDGTITQEGKDIKTGREKLAADVLKVKKYLLSRGITESEISLDPITTSQTSKKDAEGRETAEKTESYDFWQDLHVSSNDIDKIDRVSREGAEILSQGVQFESDAPKFFYSKPDALKFEMFAEALEDARLLAWAAAKKYGDGKKLGAMMSSETGMFQIIPPDAANSSDESSADTTSIKKRAIATVTAEFKVE